MARKIANISIVVLICLFAVGTGAENAPKKVMSYIAVMDLKCGKGLEQDYCDALTDVVIEELVRLKKYKVVDRANRDRILEEVGFQQTGCVEGSCTVDAGRMLGVGKIVVGAVSKMGEAYVVRLQLINVETALVEVASRETCGKCELVDVMDTVLQATLKLFGESPAAASSWAGPSPAGPTAPTATPVGRGAIKVSSTPSGADIYLDATPMGKTPKTLTNIPAGTHQLTLVINGYTTLNKGVNITAGRTTSVSEILVRLTGSIDIKSNPSGALIYINGKYIGKTPKKIPGMPVGKHKIQLKLKNYQAHSEEVTIEANGTASVSPTLRGLPGKILVTSTPSGADVYIDGRKVGQTPYSGSLSAGSHSVRVSKSGYQSFEETVTIQPNKARTLDATLKKGPDIRGDMVLVPAG